MSDFQPEQHRKHVERDGSFQARVIELPIGLNEFRIPSASPRPPLPGAIHIEMCEECGLITRANCEHVLIDGTVQGVNAFVWTADGTELICVICGKDGT